MMILPPIWYEDDQRMDLSDYPNAFLLLENNKGYLPIAKLYENFKKYNYFNSFNIIDSGDYDPIHNKSKPVLLDYFFINKEGIKSYFHNIDLLSKLEQPFARITENSWLQYISTICGNYEIYCTGNPHDNNCQGLIKSQWGVIKLPLLDYFQEIISAWVENNKLMMLTRKNKINWGQMKKRSLKADKWIINISNGKLLYGGECNIGLHELKIYAPKVYRYALSQQKLQNSSYFQGYHSTDDFDLRIDKIYSYHDMQTLYLYLNNEEKCTNPSVPSVQISCSMALDIDQDITTKTVQENIFKELKCYWEL